MTSETPQSANEFVNIHQALNEASQEAKERAEMIPCSVRIHPTVRDRAKEICERNGTDLSAFLRKCAEALVADYSKP